MIPLLDLKSELDEIKEDIQKSLNDVILSTSFIKGAMCEKFQEQMTSYLNVDHAMGVGSGTDSLIYSLEALGIGEGDEVITTPFTFFATVESIVKVGATPIFVDIDARSFNMDPEQIEKVITKKTKAILVVHLFGQPADMDTIMAIAQNKGLYVIEDACQAIGSTFDGKKVGTIGDIGCFSFYPTKNLGAYGDGGMIVTNNKSLYDKVTMLCNHGSSPKNKYLHYLVGGNSRLDEMQAAILLVKLNYLDEWNGSRQQIAQQYTNALNPLVETPYLKDNRNHIYHLYNIKTKCRDDLAQFLKEKGIVTGIYYPIPMHLQPALKNLGYKQGDFPNAEHVSKTILALPIFPTLKDDDQSLIIKTIKEKMNPK